MRRQAQPGERHGKHCARSREQIAGPFALPVADAIRYRPEQPGAQRAADHDRDAERNRFRGIGADLRANHVVPEQIPQSRRGHEVRKPAEMFRQSAQAEFE